MPKNKTSFSSPLVYSTDPFLITSANNESSITLPPENQALKIAVDKKHRAGKVVTLITGFTGKEEDIQELGRELKSYCGTGGSAKRWYYYDPGR